MNEYGFIDYSFCTKEVREKLRNFICGLKNIEPCENKLYFISYNKQNINKLKDLINCIDLKKDHIIIIPNEEDDYFDFAMKYNICNIIHFRNLDTIIFSGIVNRFLCSKKKLDVFFKDDEIIFDRTYSLSGRICMNNLTEKYFADFIENLKNMTKNSFIINSHELVTNAFAYGVLEISAFTRDKKIYDIGKFIEIPKDKEITVRLMMNKNIYGISVTDLTGSLTIRRVLERIRRQIPVGGETIPLGIEDYTGRGLAILCRHGLLSFTVKTDEYTDVSLICYLDASNKKRDLSILAVEL